MTKNQMDNIIRESAKHVKKWEPIFKAVGANHPALVEMLSWYSEYYEVSESQKHMSQLGQLSSSSPSYSGYGYGNNMHNIKPGSQLGEILHRIMSDINKLPSIRIKVEGSPLYFNMVAHRFEFKLENGEYVGSSEVPGRYSGKLSKEDIMSAFPEDFVKLIDVSEFREMRINSLIS